MGGYGIATFRGDPVRTVSDTLFRALQDAFGPAASAGLPMTEQDWQETLAERAADGQTAAVTAGPAGPGIPSPRAAP
jgi:hypothetical protein